MEQKDCIRQSLEVARLLFLRNRTCGASANMSFLLGDRVFVTASGTCFGTLTEDDFAEISLAGEHLSGKAPSKEWPAHVVMYRLCPGVQAVIHIHGRAGVLWSTMAHPDPDDCVPKHTPYLEMRVGRTGLVADYAPGSGELFQALEERILACGSRAYLLKRHGALVGGDSVMDAFYNLEELEESCGVAWELAGRSVQTFKNNGVDIFPPAVYNNSTR